MKIHINKCIYVNSFALQCYFRRVCLVVNKSTGEAVAMKMVDLGKHPDARNTVRKETTIHRMLSNPYIIQYFGQRSESNIEYIFLEYASGGELFDRIGNLYIYIYIYTYIY
jgi:serine/threonine-protein kinase Chk1